MPPKWQYVQYQMREYSQNDNLLKNEQKSENASKTTLSIIMKTREIMLLKWQFVQKCTKDRMFPNWQYVQYQTRENSQNDNLYKNAQKTECLQNDFSIILNAREIIFPKWQFVQKT